MTDLEYLTVLAEALKGAYDLTLPEAMPATLGGKALSAIREARHAIHEARCHIGDASLITHKEETE